MGGTCRGTRESPLNVADSKRGKTKHKLDFFAFVVAVVVVVVVKASLRPRRELEHLANNLKTSWHLPEEESEVDGIQSDVNRPRRLVTLLHRRRHRRSNGPQARDGRAGVQVRAREELSRSQERVEAALERENDTRAQQKVSPDGVLIAHTRGEDLLTLRLQLGNFRVLRHLRRLFLVSICSNSHLWRGHESLERLDLLRDVLARATPLETEISCVRNGTEQEELHRGVEERKRASLEDAVLTTHRVRRIVRREDERRRERSQRHASLVLHR